ncbi:MAG: DUF1217 domain-containing protein [Rhodobacteraceae bacterium]|nr:DUF1217 domain-containing protein [Paracoccaceae bacterium]
MIFQPVIVGPGLVGWNFLQATYDSQYEAFNRDPVLQRDTEYFAEKIGDVFIAEDLVADRRLLTVALGAFGLSDDLNSRAFIQKILEDGTGDPAALANRLSDDRYRQFSDAFGFGPGAIPKTLSSTLMADIVDRFQKQSFEVAVGQQDDSMRIALFSQRELERVASEPISEDAKWFTIMSSPPLRTIFESGLGLPSNIALIDIDKQLEMFKDRASVVFGNSSVSQFTDAQAVEKLTIRYLARAQIDSFNVGFSSGSIALTLLQS